MTLSKEERAALVEALENGGNVAECTDGLLTHVLFHGSEPVRVPEGE